MFFIGSTSLSSLGPAGRNQYVTPRSYYKVTVMHILCLLLRSFWVSELATVIFGRPLGISTRLGGNRLLRQH